MEGLAETSGRRPDYVQPALPPKTDKPAMKPAPFAYHRPDTVAEIHALLATYGEESRILAGGQSLVPLLNMRIMSPQALISINHCEALDRVSTVADRLVVGARVRQSAALQVPELRDGCRLLAKAMPFVGAMANRNRGTICGSLAHNDPSAELPAVAVALDAELVVSSAGGRRTVSAADFFVSELATCVEPNEFLEEVILPRDAAGVGASFVEVGVRAHGFAIAGVAVHLRLNEGGKCLQARIAGMGFGGAAIRFHRLEDELTDVSMYEADLGRFASVGEACVDPISDIHADAAYRRNLAGVLSVRGLHEAVSDARVRARGNHE